MAAENLNKLKLKTYSSTRKNTFTLVTLQSLSISGVISAEKKVSWKLKICMTNFCKFFNFQLTYMFLADTWNTKLCRVTKVKMFFLEPVYVFNSNLSECSAAILEKGLLDLVSYNSGNNRARNFKSASCSSGFELSLTIAL